MSDYFNSLFARSFMHDVSPESVRPRLPSLFEKPLASQSVNSLLANETRETIDEINRKANTDKFAHHSIEPRDHKNLEEGVYKHQPVASLLLESKEASSQSIAPHQTKKPITGKSNSPLSKETREATDEISRVEKPDSFAPHSIEPRVRKNPETAVDKDQSLHPRQLIPATPVSRLGSLPVSAEISLNIPEVKQDAQTPPDNKSDASKLSTNLIVDTALLNRLAKEKIALSANIMNTAQNDKVSSASKQSPVFVPADTSKLNIQWPQATTKKPSLNDRDKSVSELAEPVINVTIGRIEIRAAQATSNSALKSQIKKPSTMSLEEYLNKRNGGSR